MILTTLSRCLDRSAITGTYTRVFKNVPTIDPGNDLENVPGIDPWIQRLEAGTAWERGYKLMDLLNIVDPWNVLENVPGIDPWNVLEIVSGVRGVI